MPWFVRLLKFDGTTIDLPHVFPDPPPCDEDEVTLPVDGGSIRVRVEKCSDRHSGSPNSPVQSVKVVTATQLEWIEKSGTP
jgi:hypothetical protein